MQLRFNLGGWLQIVFALTALGCGDDDAGRDEALARRDAGDASGDEPLDDAGRETDAATVDSGASGGTASQLPEHCDPSNVTTLPNELSCLGLYADIEGKELATRVEPFEPAVSLWSDGAAKQRWVYLPEGETIDVSDPDNWQFPVGTKLFKEFAWKGRRVETRVFWKTSDTRWVRSAYLWNEDETEATRFGGGEVDVAGDTYYVPSAKECDQCHDGRRDKALGFEAVLLGLPGASGLTLQALVDQALLSETLRTELEIGDDGSGHAAEALGWLHVNCGVSCHNEYSNSEAYSTDLRLRLAFEATDGRDSSGLDPIVTSLDVAANTPRWDGRTRIVAGAPDDSLLYFLITTRDPAEPKDRMPPIGSSIVDADGATLIEDWITNLP